MSNKNCAKNDCYSDLPLHVFLTPGEIAQFTRYEVDTVRSWLRSGKMEGFFDGDWRVSRDEFIRFWEERRRKRMAWGQEGLA